MKIIIHIFFTFFLGVILISCESEPEIQPELPVIEGSFNSDGYPVITFSKSVSPGIDGDLASAMINWGKVTISDGEKEVILTGRKDNRYLPPFIYTTVKMTGIPGKTYTINASFKDFKASASARMPYPTPIDSLVVKPTSVDSLYSATLHFTSPPDVPAYYYITLRRIGEDARLSPALMGNIQVLEAGKHCSMQVLGPKIKIDDTIYVSNFKKGSVWEVRLNRVEKDVYEFWKAYDNMIMFSTSPLVSTNESLPTNISGGLGVWSPQGSSVIILDLNKIK